MGAGGAKLLEHGGHGIVTSASICQGDTIPSSSEKKNHSTWCCVAVGDFRLDSRVTHVPLKSKMCLLFCFRSLPCRKSVFFKASYQSLPSTGLNLDSSKH